MYCNYAAGKMEKQSSQAEFTSRERDGTIFFEDCNMSQRNIQKSNSNKYSKLLLNLNRLGFKRNGKAQRGTKITII